jgi:hypothetical protein
MVVVVAVDGEVEAERGEGGHEEQESSDCRRETTREFSASGWWSNQSGASQ